MTVRLTRHAETDLEDIADFIAQDNPVGAVRFVEEPRQKCLALAGLPLAFPLIPRYEMFGIRRRPCGDYLILYTVRDETIVVLRVLHGAREYIPLRFPDLAL